MVEKIKGLIFSGLFILFAMNKLRLSLYHRTASGFPKRAWAQFVHSESFFPIHPRKKPGPQKRIIKYYTVIVPFQVVN